MEDRGWKARRRNSSAAPDRKQPNSYLFRLEGEPLGISAHCPSCLLVLASKVQIQIIGLAWQLISLLICSVNGANLFTEWNRGSLDDLC
jgi:hypothetical protein